jgi:hypothetical protein
MRNSIKLVFYIPPNLCNTCYKKKIKLLKEHIKIIGAKNILILLPLNKIRQYKSIFQKYNIKNDIYTYNKNEAIFMQNKILAPLYFTIDLNHKVNNFFIIHKNHNLVNRYIKIIKNKYF